MCSPQRPCRDPEAASDDTRLLQPWLFTSVLPNCFPNCSKRVWRGIHEQTSVKYMSSILILGVSKGHHFRAWKDLKAGTPSPRYTQSMWPSLRQWSTQGKAVMADASASRRHHTHGFYSCNKCLGASPRHWPHSLPAALGHLSSSPGGKTDCITMICS